MHPWHVSSGTLQPAACRHTVLAERGMRIQSREYSGGAVVGPFGKRLSLWQKNKQHTWRVLDQVCVPIRRVTRLIGGLVHSEP